MLKRASSATDSICSGSALQHLIIAGSCFHGIAGPPSPGGDVRPAHIQKSSHSNLQKVEGVPPLAFSRAPAKGSRTDLTGNLGHGRTKIKVGHGTNVSRPPARSAAQRHCLVQRHRRRSQRPRLSLAPPPSPAHTRNLGKERSWLSRCSFPLR